MTVAAMTGAKAAACLLISIGKERVWFVDLLLAQLGQGLV